MVAVIEVRGNLADVIDDVVYSSLSPSDYAIDAQEYAGFRVFSRYVGLWGENVVRQDSGRDAVQGTFTTLVVSEDLDFDSFPLKITGLSIDASDLFPLANRVGSSIWVNYDNDVLKRELRDQDYMIFGSYAADMLMPGKSILLIENDWLSGMGGNDTMAGGMGNDTLLGGNGADRILGGLGADFVDGGEQRDWLSGAADADTLKGGAGQDVLYGGGQNDSLTGDDGNDRLLGQGDNDNLHGGIGDDRLFGGSGNDTLNGGGGNDRLFGGAGEDRFVFGGLRGADLIADFTPEVDVIKVMGDYRLEDTAEGTVIHHRAGTVLLVGVALAQLGADDIL